METTFYEIDLYGLFKPSVSSLDPMITLDFSGDEKCLRTTGDNQLISNLHTLLTSSNNYFFLSSVLYIIAFVLRIMNDTLRIF